MKPTVVHVAASPLQITTMLEQAKAELDRNQPARAREYVEGALARLATDRAAQDQVLDEDARTVEGSVSV